MKAVPSAQRFAALLSLLLATGALGIAQKGGGGAAVGSAGSAASASVPTTSRPTSNPSSPNNPTTSNPGMDQINRPVFIDGRVMFDDGTPPNVNIRIERICGASVHLQSHVDNKGQFYFQLGHSTELDTDAASSSSGFSVPGGPANRPVFGGNGGVSELGCEIRASYPGYRSDIYNMPSQSFGEEQHVGTLILHRLAGVTGTTVSLTTALAPKHAQKDYQKGLELAAKGKFEEAEQRLSEATDLYPKYAVAWCTLGEVQLRTGKPEAARHSFETSITSDKQYVSPYNQLALLSGQEGKWDQTVQFSRKALDLNPVEFVSAYWFNALGNYHVHNLAEAEKSARQVIKMDTVHQYPQVENMLANILLQRGAREEATQHLRAYLTLAPNAQDVPQVKALLAQTAVQNPAPSK